MKARSPSQRSAAAAAVLLVTAALCAQAQQSGTASQPNAPQGNTTQAASAGTPAPANQNLNKTEKQEQGIAASGKSLTDELAKLTNNPFVPGAINAINNIVTATREGQNAVRSFVDGVYVPIVTLECKDFAMLDVDEMQNGNAALAARVEKARREADRQAENQALENAKNSEATRASQRQQVSQLRAENQDRRRNQETTPEEVCGVLVNDVRDTLDELREDSYTDALYQNGNLTNQLRVRLPIMIKMVVDATNTKPRPAASAQEASPTVSAPAANTAGAGSPADAAAKAKAEAEAKAAAEAQAQADAEARRPEVRWARLSNFDGELRLIRTRFLETRKFRAGFGVSLSYLPRMFYRERYTIDFSPFQDIPATLGGGDVSEFIDEFSGRSAAGVTLSADTPYIQVNAMFTKLEDDNVSSQRVQVFDIDNTTREILLRTTIDTSLKSEYEVGLMLKPREIVRGVYRRICAKLADRNPSRCNNYDPGESNRPILSRNDFGFGIGLSGFEATNEISADLRFRTDGVTPFNDLPANAVVKTEDSTSFNTRFDAYYWTYHISDELDFRLDYRSYKPRRSSEVSVNVNDDQTILSVLWYPTWSF